MHSHQVLLYSLGLIFQLKRLPYIIQKSAIFVFPCTMNTLAGCFVTDPRWTILCICPFLNFVAFGDGIYIFFLRKGWSYCFCFVNISSWHATIFTVSIAMSSFLFLCAPARAQYECFREKKKAPDLFVFIYLFCQLTRQINVLPLWSVVLLCRESLCPFNFHEAHQKSLWNPRLFTQQGLLGE